MAVAEGRGLQLGISSCLLGDKVRYDGGHKLDCFLRDTLGPYVKYVPVCPEVECGLPVPREAMRLVGDPAAPRLVTVKTGSDHTERVLSWARRRVCALEQEDLSGFVFKSKSPSSGMARVEVHTGKGRVVKRGVGLFARTFMAHFPLLPVEDDGRLHDPGVRESFIDRVFSMRRWRDFLRAGPSPDRLALFHTRQELLIRAHSPAHCRELGRVAGAARSASFPAALAAYQQAWMKALALRLTRCKHVNVLQHVVGHLKRDLTAVGTRALVDAIRGYGQGHVSLNVPVALLNYYAREQDNRYLAAQVYLAPQALELQLRKHA